MCVRTSYRVRLRWHPDHDTYVRPTRVKQKTSIRRFHLLIRSEDLPKGQCAWRTKDQLSSLDYLKDYRIWKSGLWKPYTQLAGPIVNKVYSYGVHHCTAWQSKCDGNKKDEVSKNTHTCDAKLGGSFAMERDPWTESDYETATTHSRWSYTYLIESFTH